jgi:hypothetical protein
MRVTRPVPDCDRSRKASVAIFIRRKREAFLETTISGEIPSKLAQLQNPSCLAGKRAWLARVVQHSIKKKKGPDQERAKDDRGKEAYGGPHRRR